MKNSLIPPGVARPACRLLVAITLFSAGCEGKGTSTGNPMVQLKFASFSSLGAGKVSTLAVSQLLLCFKRLRFKTAEESTNPDPSLDSDNLDFDIGEVAVLPAGTTLGNIRVPAGSYSRIEFDLEDHCPSGLSAQVFNSQADSPFSTNQRITIKFNGSINIINDGQVVNMAIDNIITAADSVTANNQIRTALESASGSF